eukprot:597493-Heterocapsa_arctica.AAC.1
METLWPGKRLLLCTGGRLRLGKLPTRRTPGLSPFPSLGSPLASLHEQQQQQRFMEDCKRTDGYS